MLMLVSLYTERETRPLSLLTVTRVLLYLHNRRHAVLTHVSLLSQKRARFRS
jgi:hypothetical protein